jgi:hypothetical protein
LNSGPGKPGLRSGGSATGTFPVGAPRFILKSRMPHSEYRIRLSPCAPRPKASSLLFLDLCLSEMIPAALEIRGMSPCSEERTMPKKPKIDHEYHASKDKMKITIQGYSPSKKAREVIMKKVIRQLEGNPDRLIADAKIKSKKKPHNPQKESKLIEIGD